MSQTEEFVYSAGWRKISAGFRTFPSKPGWACSGENREQRDAAVIIMRVS
jgi:hypothetical protein